MPITHHPDNSTLMSYAAGSLAEALSAVVANHVALCPVCAREVRAMERIGTVLLDGLAPRPLDRAAPQMALRAMEADVEGGAPSSAAAGTDVPRPLQGLVGERLDEIPWKRLGKGLWHHPLKLAGGEGDLRLLKVAAGLALPEHGHGGTELTLLLRGSYRDAFGHYRAGDISDLGDDVEHQPVADQDVGCICLIGSERRVRLKGLLGRLVQPLTRI